MFTTFFESERFPMELTFEQTHDAYSGSIDRYDNEDVKDNILRYGGTAKFASDHQLRIDYQRDERHERYPGTKTTFDTTQNVLRLDDRLQFGPSTSTCGRTPSSTRKTPATCPAITSTSAPGSHSSTARN